MTSNPAQAASAPPVSIEEQLEWLRLMHEIRFFEDECHMLFARGLVRGSTHLCQGQEGVVVGACRALRRSDTMACTYRGHGAVIAKGAPLDRAFGEILGKDGGLCGGKGGSMHLTDMTVGAIGSFAIIGAHLPITLGAAFAASYRGTDDVSHCFFGDGAANIGAFHEALNIAAVWALPVVFVCENNLYMEYTPIGTVTAVANPAADRAPGYGIPAEVIDGNDVVVVAEAVTRAAARARDGAGPSVIEARTYRHFGHSRTDPGAYRPDEEVAHWLSRDPLDIARARLAELGTSDRDIEQAGVRAAALVREAIAAAKAAPGPDPAQALADVWADGGSAWRT
jgi:pyruvate dehydrogenase E1 component alpha subunit